MIERILFFGNTTNWVKKSRIKNLCKYKLNSSIEIVLKNETGKNQKKTECWKFETAHR